MELIGKYVSLISNNKQYTGRSHLMPIVGHSSSNSPIWQLNSKNLQFSLSGPLTYSQVSLYPQNSLSSNLSSPLLSSNLSSSQTSLLLSLPITSLLTSALTPTSLHTHLRTYRNPNTTYSATSWNNPTTGTWCVPC